MRTSVDIRVTGRVQGVSFRYYAEREAARRGIAGWVRNEPDGSVAAHAEGRVSRVDFVAARAAESLCGRTSDGVVAVGTRAAAR